MEIRIDYIADLAVEQWRMRRTLTENSNSEGLVALRRVARKYDRFFEKCEVEILDLTGKEYDPGLPIEVVHSEVDAALPPGRAVVSEVLSPVILWRGKVIHHGRAVTTRSSAEAGARDATS